jgi:peptidoglycan/xylan/chitin deacetylase (PgdA/CDA1 family)
MTHTLQRFLARSSGGFVLAFHEIVPERLAGFVDCIHPCRPVHLSELVERSKNRKPTSGLFAITIDDGVGDNVRALSRLFKQRSWPATFYLPSDYMNTREGMVFQWWRRMKPMLPQRPLELKSGVIDLSRPGAADGLYKTMEERWHTERLESYLPMTKELIALVARETGRPSREWKPDEPISWTEVAALAKDDLIRFESHGVSHSAMSSLTEEELVSEMRYSRDVVAEHTGQPCRHLAYPFGSDRSIGRRAALVAEQFYDSATTMSLGHVDSANPWMLPRIPLYPENSPTFARTKILLKCSAVSPLKSAPVRRAA